MGRWVHYSIQIQLEYVVVGSVTLPPGLMTSFSHPVITGFIGCSAEPCVANLLEQSLK